MEAINSIDFSILDFIQNTFRCGFLDAVFPFVGTITNAGLLWIAIAAGMLFFRKTRPAGVMMLAAMALGYLTGDLIIKHLVMRPRPFLVNTDFTLFIKAPSGYSFPSGHTTAAFASATVLFIKHRRAGIAALAGAVIIAFSRLYCYVHYPSDVLCGIALGVLSAIVITVLFKKTRLDDKLSKIGSKNKS